MTRAAETAMPARGQRSAWLKHLHRWHWISSAISLVGMLLFAATGITLNHAADIGGTPQVTERSGLLPPALRDQLSASPQDGEAPLPRELRDWLARALSVRTGTAPAEWSEEEIHLDLKCPGGDAWLRIDRQSGAVQYERTTRGAIAYLNDLHKGRNTGAAWSWFLDIFAGACVVFCVTGMVLLYLHAGTRPSTWPMVGLGVVVPLLLIILFIH
jgi:hypothetical protein